MSSGTIFCGNGAGVAQGGEVSIPVADPQRGTATPLANEKGFLFGLPQSCLHSFVSAPDIHAQPAEFLFQLNDLEFFQPILAPDPVDVCEETVQDRVPAITAGETPVR